jgi:hypothetical protein
MSNANDLFNKLDNMPLDKLLNLCALAIEEKMEQKRLDMLLMLAETKLAKYRLISRLGMKHE